jgi:membrane-bound serine protease (ClpP class)
VLLILIFGGLFLEMKTPGFGFAGTIALIAIFLFFGPHYVNGLAESWEIAVFLLGIVLIALEIFVIPGFGVTGVLGIFFAVAGVAAALLENKGTSLEYVTIGDILRSVALVLVMLTTSILLVIWVAKHLVTSRAAYPFVDTAVQDKEDGYIAVNKKMFDLIGEEGDAITDLRPVGFVMIGEKQYDAEAKEGYISKGQRIVVERVNSVNLIVKKVTTA